MPGIDTALDTLKGLSRSFLLGYFFPLVLFVLANTGLYVAMFGTSAAKAVIDGLGLSSLLGLALVSLVGFGAAWILSALTTPLRQLLEGDGLPEWFRSILIDEAQLQVPRFEERARQAREHVGRMETAFADWLKDLQDKRALGVAANQVDRAEVDRLVKLVAKASLSLQGRGEFGERAQAVIDRANTLVSEAGIVLSSCAAEGASDPAASARLDAAHMQLVDKLRLAKDEAWNRADEAGHALTSKFVPGDIRASRLGNLRAVIEDYTRTAYKVHFSYLWPRLQAVLTEGDAVAPTLERAKAQLEFAVVMIGGTAITGVVWMIMVLAWEGPVALFIALGAATPLLLGFFYRVALEGQKAFTEMVRAAIDTKRLELLGALGAARPERTAAEVELWRSLQDLSLGIPAEIPLKAEV